MFCALNHRNLNTPIIQDSVDEQNEDNYIIKSDDEEHLYETD